jgi:hypothetical protein
MNKHGYGQLALGFLALITLLALSAVPTLAMVHGGSMGGSGFHGASMHGGSFPHAGFHHPGVGVHNRVFFGNRVFVGHHHAFFRPCCFGPRVFVGFGVGVPFWYPYPYPYPSYAPAAVAEPSPPTYLQQDYQPQQQQYWYYCQGAQTYYPYVKECRGGWLTVVPQASPPPSGTPQQ